MNTAEAFAFMVGVEGHYAELGASKEAMAGIETIKLLIRAAEKRETALHELEGFAKRNRDRAEKAFDISRAAKKYWDDREDQLNTQQLCSKAEAELEYEKNAARFHEAQRFYDVIALRVREALAP